MPAHTTYKRRPRTKRRHTRNTRNSKRKRHPHRIHPTYHHPHTIYIYFVHVPKTAGSAIKQVLATNDLQRKGIKSEGWTLRTRSGTTVRIIARGHCAASQFPPRARNVFKMATVRDPVDRFISAYNFVREGGKHHPNQGAVQQARNWAPFLQRFATIDDFLHDEQAVRTIMHPKTGHTHFDHLMRWVHNRNGQPDIDFYIRQTHVNTDFKAFCRTFDLALDNDTIKPFNVTGEKSKETKTTRKRIQQLLKTDIGIYNKMLNTLDTTHRDTLKKVGTFRGSSSYKSSFEKK